MSTLSYSLILRPKKSSAIWLLLGSAVFVAGGILMAQKQGWIGYAIAGFFLICTCAAIAQLVPGSSYLSLDEDGFSFAAMFRVTRVPWDVIEEFFVVSMSHTGMKVHQMVGFNFVPSYEGSKGLRRLSSSITGCEGALPDTYGMKAEELAEFMNRCLAEFRNSSGSIASD